MIRLFRHPVPLVLACTLAAACGEIAKVETAAKLPSAAELPGAEPRDAETLVRLGAAWRDRPDGYVPRTRHVTDGGEPKYTNRLFLESSPYLLQHAHNPVDWYPWGDEAFAAARRLDRPVLLSIGYSTCHWCHVMEEESFEDEGIARYLNEHYVAIKVDREERPDVDAVYMSAVQELTGRGGWPMTVWLTPDREPFYGGTYFPARDGDRGARVGFLTILGKLSASYNQKRETTAVAASSLAAEVRENLTADATGDLPDHGALHHAFAYCRDNFDSLNGGMRRAPKFPSNMPVRLLLRYHRRAGDESALRMAGKTLDAMAAGGMRDQLGGGFHRYSTDARWLVPHFEMMLYDNAQLAIAYLEAWQATGRAEYAEVTREILAYVEREMTGLDGAFYASTDADSATPSGHREEGRFFTWTAEEIVGVVGAEAGRTLAAYWGVTPGGNYEGRSILHVPRPLGDVATELGIGADRAREVLAAGRGALLAARALRPRPLRDEKIITAWNALMISAFARAGAALREPKYVEIAADAADAVLSAMPSRSRLLRTSKDGRASRSGYLDDHAFFIAALLDLFEATASVGRLDDAIAMDRTLEQHFEDRERGGYFMTANDDEKLIAREKPSSDGAEPSGNSVQALNLLRLHSLTGDDAYRRRADRTLGAFGVLAARAPVAVSELLLAVDYRLDSAKEIVIVTGGSPTEAEPLLVELGRRFVPNRVLVVARVGDPGSVLSPLLEGKVALGGRATAYVCENRICDLPTTDPAVFSDQIARVRPLPRD